MASTLRSYRCWFMRCLAPAAFLSSGQIHPGLSVGDAPLFFANAELFKERVLEAAATSPTPVRWLVVAAEPVTSVDVTAADSLAELDEALRRTGIELCFAELKD